MECYYDYSVIETTEEDVQKLATLSSLLSRIVSQFAKV